LLAPRALLMAKHATSKGGLDARLDELVLGLGGKLER
jgi:hypothetical protein